jgi:hypothetical protein
MSHVPVDIRLAAGHNLCALTCARVFSMASDEHDESDESGENDPLGPARPVLTTALVLGSRAAETGDRAGAYALLACAAKLARKVRGLGEVADFRLERALEEADNAVEPDGQFEELRAGLEGLLGDELAADSLPESPLTAAQALIGRAISIGAPAYNTGDQQGCYDVYACTARAILATLRTLPDAAAVLLREGLSKAASLDDPDAQAWAMRHAFDAVGDLSDGAGTSRPVRALVSMATALGEPAFNLGDHRGCFEVYACTARLLLNIPATSDKLKSIVRRALMEAATIPNVTRQARLLRDAFDALLGESE